MPTYDYLCSTCGFRFEQFQAMSDEPLNSCPQCQGSVRRLVSGGSGLIFKGSGFYLTDYKKQSSSGEASAKSNTTKNDTASKNAKPKADTKKES